ncbi:MAG: fimbrillin family protein [Alistipes sp.]|nr:fimbrillin family protein [Alistipes sp.]
MKKIISKMLALALVSAIGVSCDNEVPDGGNFEQGNEIRFSDLVTRAGDPENEAEKLLNTINDFGVYGQVSDQEDPNPETSSNIPYTQIFDKLNVYRGADSWEYDPAEVQYWLGNRAYHFFAFWPYNTATSLDNRGGYKVSYETPGTANGYLLGAHEIVDVDGVFPDVVKFKFSHLLSRVCLNISQDNIKNPYDDYMFRIKAVRLSNVKKNGTLSTSRTNQAGTWTYDNARLTFESVFDDESGLLEGSKVIAPWGANGQGYHFIPQSFEKGDISLIVEYAFKETTASEWESKTASTSLPAGAWSPGVTYTYQMKVYEDNFVTFSNISVEGWGSYLTGGAIIIK